ncbi:hypothetical protein WA026_022283 [Henosepilachna vigintioctopunctata]|uniref:Uncharacterized protein n=1 Tax=Henosepilachna vigintioctopunctata TaxID=420089 RepID=A0AAW1VHD9_9CUCU
MASLEVFPTELNKINKNKLIEMIYFKRVPENVLLSENVQSHINSVNLYGYVSFVSSCEFQDALSENSSPNLEVQLRIVGLENEHSVGEAGCDVADIDNISQQPSSAIRSKLEFQQNARNDRQSDSVSANYASALDTGTKKDKKVSVFGLAKLNAESTTMFFGADRFAWVHLGRAALKTSEEADMNHLTQKFPGKKLVLEALPVEQNAKSCSFILI